MCCKTTPALTPSNTSFFLIKKHTQPVKHHLIIAGRQRGTISLTAHSPADSGQEGERMDVHILTNGHHYQHAFICFYSAIPYHGCSWEQGIVVV